MDHIIFCIFFILSVLPGLCFVVVPLCVLKYRQKKYSLKVQAEVVNRHWFTWLDDNFYSHPGVQLAYRYDAGDGTKTRRGRPIHDTKEVPKDDFVTLYVNPRNTNDIWEDRDRQGLYITMAFGLALMIAGAVAAIVYFCV